jgi:hypothetical protein
MGNVPDREYLEFLLAIEEAAILGVASTFSVGSDLIVTLPVGEISKL